jgi:hypothetical protein
LELFFLWVKILTPLFFAAIYTIAGLYFFPRHKLVILYSLPIFTAAIAMGIMVWMMFQRVDYNYELEWVEGGVFQQVVRILEGHAPYSKPSFEYVPALYAPLYYYVSAGFSLVLGKGLPALRAVSVLATLVTSIVIALSVLHLTKSRLAAFLGFLAYSTMYLHTLCWFDVGRVDSLWTMWLSITVIFLLYQQPRYDISMLIISAVSFVLAIFTKQISLFSAPFLFMTIWLWSGLYKASIFMALVAIAVIGIGALFQQHSGGWFYFFTLELAPAHGMKEGMLSHFFWVDIVGKIPVVAVFSLLFVRIINSSARVRMGWLSLTSAFVGMSLLSRMYTGGESNVLMPLYMLLTIMSVSYFEVVVKKYQDSRIILLGVLSVLLAVNFQSGWVAEPAEYHVPNRRPGGDDAIGDALVKKISQVSGRVCITMHGYLAYLAGKEFCSHRLLVQDVLMGNDNELAESLRTDARKKIMEGYYQVIIIDDYVDIQGFGINIQDIPYSMKLLENDTDYPQYEFYPIVSGTKPRFWLEYNGKGFVDETAKAPPSDPDGKHQAVY